MIEALKARYPELLDARLVKLDDGTWMDIVRWSSREAAERAAASFSDVREARAMNDLIEEVMSFEHGVDAEPSRV